VILGDAVRTAYLFGSDCATGMRSEIHEYSERVVRMKA
jgi:hypothetical protein